MKHQSDRNDLMVQIVFLVSIHSTHFLVMRRGLFKIVKLDR
jgi:hypothetical protein